MFVPGLLPHHPDPPIEPLAFSTAASVMICPWQPVPLSLWAKLQEFSRFFSTRAWLLPLPPYFCPLGIFASQHTPENNGRRAVQLFDKSGTLGVF